MSALVSEVALILLSSSLCLYLLFALIKFLYNAWWTPTRVQYLMRSQGIKGPSYKFIHGSTKEILKLRNESINRPMMDLSHNIYPRVQPHIYSWTKTYGKNFLYWHGPRAHLVVSEPELIKEILNNRDKVFPKADLQSFSKKLLGDGLVTSEGEKWSKMRKLANPAFHAESLKNMIPVMTDAVEMILKRWKNLNGKEIDMFEEFRLLTSEVISRTAFGSSYQEGKNIFDMLSQLCTLIHRNGFRIRLSGISKILKTGDEIEAEKLEKGVRESILEMLKKREEHVVTGEVESFGSDFLGLLVKACHDDDQSNRISVEDLIDECRTLYFAGQETTNVLLSWIVFLLAIHTEWQEEARSEVFKIFGHKTPNADGIARLKIISMIISETLRLYPPVLGLTRKVVKEVQLGKFTIPADINLYISNIARQHDPHIWGEDVHLFKPDRFSEGIAKATNNNASAYLPFGLGPRSCLGSNFATMEAKIALSMILQRYSFTLSPAYVHSPFHFLTIHPEHGIQVMINPL